MRREQVAPSVLPFSESGRVIDSPTVSPTAASATASGAASAGIASPSASSEEALSPRSPRSIGESAAVAVTEGSTNGNGGAPWPCAWQSWQILAYSTVLRSLVWPKASHERCGVLRELEQQQLSTPVHHHVYNASTIPGVPPAVAAVVGNLPDEQGMLPLPARRILRQGRLFSMTGLFHQPIPVVGTLISEPTAAPGAAQVQGTVPGSTFSMQGYAHVADANAAESGGGFTQFEYYKLSVAGNNGNGGSTGSGSGSITASMVAAAQAQAGEASPPAQPGSAASSASSAAAVPGVSPLTVQLGVMSAPRTPPRSGGRPGSEGGLGGEFGFGPESPPSAHLFASASFATLSGSGLLEQHFTPSSSAAAASSAPATGAQQDAILPSLEHQPPVVRHLSSASSTSSTSSSSSSMTPEPFLALERHQASLPPSVAAATETWTGLYRVIQAPSIVAADGAAETTVVRPRVEVYYELRLLVAREHNNGAALSPSAAGGGAAGASH